jgi:hypothetical protein
MRGSSAAHGNHDRDRNTPPSLCTGLTSPTILLSLIDSNSYPAHSARDTARANTSKRATAWTAPRRPHLRRYTTLLPPIAHAPRRHNARTPTESRLRRVAQQQREHEQRRLPGPGYRDGQEGH